MMKNTPNTLDELMDRLTILKKYSVMGDKTADAEIKGIAETLMVCGVKWAYHLNSLDDTFTAILK